MAETHDLIVAQGVPSGRKFVQNQTKGIDVRGWECIATAPKRFRCQVPRCPHGLAVVPPDSTVLEGGEVSVILLRSPEENQEKLDKSYV